MIRYVVDASAIGPLMFEDEAEDAIPMLSDALTLGECIVPVHWRFEVANQLLSGVRRKRVAPAHAEAILTDLAEFPVEFDLASIERAWSQSHALASRHGLTLYDAAYLELAERLGLALISLDKKLLRAAANDQVVTITKP